MKRLLDWFDQRTGYRKVTHEALHEPIPGGARWRYVWGSTLTFCFVVQVITGFALWMAYSPGSQTAWESVYYIQHQMTGGWLLRGIHSFTAQAMNILLVLHLMQVMIDGAYKAPREVNFWVGLILLQLVLALSLTGYLLPWDQKGYWATKVATNLLGIVPFIGADLQKLVVGGPDYGHHTLTRFFALHAGVLPAAMVALIVGHVWLFRRHGITTKKPHKKRDSHFWPDQVLMDTVACLAVTAAVLFLCVRHKIFGTAGPLGAELGAPADPSEPFSAARPEWYFLFLFQFLKYFPGSMEIWGAIIIPGIVMFVMFLLPKLGETQRGHRFNLALLCGLILGSGWLTWQAMKQDGADPGYRLAVVEADRDAHRAAELARSPDGIPISGAASLLRADPLTQGPKLFAKNCASCHRFDGHDGTGRPSVDPQTASDLKGFASREWLAGLLDPARVDSPHYFGATKFKEGKMVKWVKKNVTAYTPDQKAQLQKVIMAVSAEAGLRSQNSADRRDAAAIKEGAALLRGDIGCTECHAFQKPDEDATAPLLTGYGSRDWLIRFISHPAHPDFYPGTRDDKKGMPAFGVSQILDAQSIGLISDWLRGQWYEPSPRATK